MKWILPIILVIYVAVTVCGHIRRCSSEYLNGRLQGICEQRVENLPFDLMAFVDGQKSLREMRETYGYNVNDEIALNRILYILSLVDTDGEPSEDEILHDFTNKAVREQFIADMAYSRSLSADCIRNGKGGAPNEKKVH